MDYRDAKKRFLAAQTLLLEPSTSLEKFSSIKELIAGFNPELDRMLEHTERELVTLERVLKLNIIPLAIDNLPETTDEEKRRKKAVLFFFKTWNSLKDEVSRVQAEINAAQGTSNSSDKGWHIARILNFAKGPLATVTVFAIAVVAAGTYTAKSSVQITIENQGCPAMIPNSSLPQFIPGVSFPTEPIASGQRGIVRLPGVPIVIDNSTKGKLEISSFTLHVTFDLGAVTEATFDNEDLLMHTTQINLAASKTHVLVLACK